MVSLSSVGLLSMAAASGSALTATQFETDNASYRAGQIANRATFRMRKLDVTECPQQVQLYQDLDQIVSRISTETAPGKTAGRGEGSNLQSFISTVEAYGKLPEMSNGCDDDSRQSLLDDLRVCTAPFGEKDFSPSHFVQGWEDIEKNGGWRATPYIENIANSLNRGGDSSISSAAAPTSMREL